jgi:hypothetical protein
MLGPTLLTLGKNIHVEGHSWALCLDAGDRLGKGSTSTSSPKFISIAEIKEEMLAFKIQLQIAENSDSQSYADNL